ncbi:MAG: DUF2877 domain-containing protein [Burkholderiales bacterium]|nr:DUF2877 domain-containing protein [Burkholderiales bacterium]
MRSPPSKARAAPRFFRAEALGRAARRALAPGRRGRVIARFARSIYVATSGGLACIGSPAIGHGPLNVLARLGNALPEPGERLACGRGTVRFSGGLALALAGASTWTPPPLPRARRARLRLPRIAPPFPEAAAALQAWLRAGGRGPLPAAVGGLVGRGAGLTPAGDDLLGGALVALCALGERALARRLARPVLAAARAGTQPHQSRAPRVRRAGRSARGAARGARGDPRRRPRAAARARRARARRSQLGPRRARRRAPRPQRAASAYSSATFSGASHADSSSMRRASGRTRQASPSASSQRPAPFS